MKGVLPWLALVMVQEIFCPALAALVCPVKLFFSQPNTILIYSSHCPASLAGSRAESPVSEICVSVYMSANRCQCGHVVNSTSKYDIMTSFRHYTCVCNGEIRTTVAYLSSCVMIMQKSKL
jgi:hypothetical protein